MDNMKVTIVSDCDLGDALRASDHLLGCSFDPRFAPGSMTTVVIDGEELARILAKFPGTEVIVEAA